MKKPPSVEEMGTAAEWLKSNEGDNGESEACSRVADWLAAYAQEVEIRAAARRVGCSVSYFKKHVALASKVGL